MNIQLSVTVWTVICFVLLMIILHNLLFKPVLKVMDQRRERIKKAQEKKAEFDNLQAQHQSMLLEKQAEFAELQQNQLKSELDSIHAAGKKAIDTAREDRIALVENCRLRAAEKQEEIIACLDAHSEELSLLFAENLLEG